MQRVFAYGTLKRGFPNHEALLAGQRFLGRYRTRDLYPLVVAGRWFSPVMIGERGAGLRVIGEAFAVSDEALTALDAAEGTHLPGGCERIAISLESMDGAEAIEAWTYVKDRARIDIVHSAPMAEYALDPRYVPPAQRRR